MFWKFGGRRFEEGFRSILAKGRPEWDLSYGVPWRARLRRGLTYELLEVWTWRESKVKNPGRGQGRGDWKWERGKWLGWWCGRRGRVWDPPLL